MEKQGTVGDGKCWDKEKVLWEHPGELSKTECLSRSITCVEVWRHLGVNPPINLIFKKEEKKHTAAFIIYSETGLIKIQKNHGNKRPLGVNQQIQKERYSY